VSNCGGYKVENKGDGSRDPLGCILGSILGAFFTGGLSLLALPFAFLDKCDPRADGSIEYLCQLCGYKWFHIPGTPWPAINVCPELIREGAEKLRQEEEERRRRMND
jgi:hypothetical protein